MAIDPLGSGTGLDLTQPVAGLDPLNPDPNFPGPFKRGLKTGVSDLKSIGGGILQYAGRATGFGAMEKAGAEIGTNAAAESAPYRMQVEDVGKAFDQGVGPGLGAAADLVKYSIGNQIPMMGASILGGVAGRLGAIPFMAKAAAGATAVETALAATKAAKVAEIGAELGVLGSSSAMELGQIAPEGLKPENNAPLGQMAFGSLISGATDTVLPVYLARKTGLIGIAEKALAPRTPGFGAVAKDVGATALKAGAFETGQEGLQTYIERASANQPLTGADANSDVLNSAVMGGIMGVLTGGIAGGVHGMSHALEAPVQETPPAAAPATPEPASPAAPPAPAPPTIDEQHAAATTQLAALEPQLVQAQTEHDALVARRTELVTELAKDPGERRAKAEILVERKDVQKQIEVAKAQVETLGGQLHSARTTIADLAPQIEAAKRQNAPSPPVIAPDATNAPDKTLHAAPLGSSIIADPNTPAPTMQEHIDRAVAGVHALFREQGMPLTTTRESLATPTPAITPREIAIERQGGRGATTDVSEQTRQGASETAMVQAIQHPTTGIKALIAAKAEIGKWEPGRTEKVTTALTNDLNSVAGEASALQSPAARDKFIAAKVVGTASKPGVLWGKVHPDDAHEVAKTMRDAAGQAHTLYSKGAIEKPTTFYRATNPGSTERIKTGDVGWDSYLFAASKEESAKPYGKQLEKITAKPGAKILYEGSHEFRSVGKGLTGNMSLLTWASTIAQRAKAAGFDAVHFKRQSDIGTAILNPEAFNRDVQESNAALTQDEFDRLPEPAQFAAVDAFNKIMREKGTALRDRIAHLFGDHPGLVIKTFMATAGSPIGSYTRVSRDKAVISLALNAKNELSVADHEAFHAIEDQLMTASERAIVANALKDGRPLFKQLLAKIQQYDAENNTHLADEITSIPAEARAYAFEFWRRGELKAEGALARVFQTIRNFLDKIVNLIHGQGFQSIEDIFTAIDRGQFAQRSRSETTTTQSELVLASKAADYLQSPAFKKWFGESKVVDAQGNPLVVYHGTHADFNEFGNQGGRAEFDSGYSGKGFYFGNAPTASVYAGAGRFAASYPAIGGRVMPVYLSMHNPLVIQEMKGGDDQIITVARALGVPLAPGADGINAKRLMPSISDDVTAALKAHGYDGVIYKWVGGNTEYMVPTNTQIKSAIGNTGAFDANNPDIRFSRGAPVGTPDMIREALADQTRRYQAGELTQEQFFQSVTGMMDDASERSITGRQAAGALKAEGVNTFTKARMPFATGNYIARKSLGYKNVVRVLEAQVNYKKTLISEGSEIGLSSWHAGTQDDRAAAFGALMKRTVGGFLTTSDEFKSLRAGLTESQRTLFDQAPKVIERFLNMELTADEAQYKLVMPETEYAEWQTNRAEQVANLIANGYIPERRYGDHTVRLTVTMPDGEVQTVGYEQFERKSAAILAAEKYQQEIAASGAEIKVEVGDRYRAEHDTGVSIQQFLDTARRHGVQITQPEKERLSRALIAADSMRRNRMMRRENVPGFSVEGFRVLNEFVVTMANKVAHSTFSSAVNDSLTGKPVDVRIQNDAIDGPSTTTANGALAMQTNHNEDANLWTADGTKSGFYHNLADELADRVLIPGEGSAWSSGLKGAAMAYFLGGSLGAGAVQMFSLPMNTMPWLSMHTSYTNAFASSMSAASMALKNSMVLRDMTKLTDMTVSIPAIDAVPGLRQALITAAKDGTTMDMEIYQIMGISRGGMMSQSKTVQKAMDVWMAPFKYGEQVSRIASFIAAYKVGQDNKLTGRDLYEFSRGVVDNTQNRFDEVNRPAIANHPVWSLLFMFKSFPLFMTEMVGTMFKQNPKSAVYMLLGLTAMTGIQGLPFAETIENLIDTIAQQLFGSPFNTRRAMRNALKDASEAMVGADLSELFLRGGMNELMGVSMSSRVGMGDFIPGSRAGAADQDYGRTVKELLGAPFSMATDIGSNIGNLAGGVAKGDFDQITAAIRAGGPAAFRNVIKGAQQAGSGESVDSQGRKLVDVSTPEALMQAMGLSSAAVNKAYEMDKIDRQTQAFYVEVRKDFTNQLVRAVKSGDAAKAQEIVTAVQAWDKEYPEQPIMLSGQTIRRDVMMSGLPLNARTMQMLPKQLRGTSFGAEGISQ